MLTDLTLQTVCHALNIRDDQAQDLMKAAGGTVDPGVLVEVINTEGSENNRISAEQLKCFLNGLIELKRGKRELKPGQKPQPEGAFTNNSILKKLRIALELQEDALLEIFSLGGADLSPSELTGFFRSPDNKHYRNCGEKDLKVFLSGLKPYLKNQR